MVYTYLTTYFSRTLIHICCLIFQCNEVFTPVAQTLDVRPFVRLSVRFLQSATPLTVTTQWIDLSYIMYLKYIAVVHNGF